MMLFEAAAVSLGIVLSFFLKDVNFLGLNLEFMNTGIIYPDFLLIFLIYFSLVRGEFAGLWIGFFAGLLEDSAILSFSPGSPDLTPIIGTHAAVYTLTGYVLGRLKTIIDRESMVPIVVMVFSTTIVVRVLIWLLMGLFEDFNRSYPLLGPAVYTAFLSPIWFAFLGWFFRFQGKTEEER